MRRILFIVFCFLVSNLLLAQKKRADTLYLMNGRIVVSPVLDTSFLAATFIDPEDSTKRTHIENDQLFWLLNIINGSTCFLLL